jgi:hypothetical protein
MSQALENLVRPDTAAHTCNISTWEVEEDCYLEGPTWVTERDEILSQKTNKEQQQQKKTWSRVFRKND